MASGPFRPGDQVPATGIYTATHDQHRTPHEVFAVQGEYFPPCRRCGSNASFTLLRTASQLDGDHDFSGSAQKERSKKAKAGPTES
jgi:hypothetical protein